ncbi:hypothetical protein HK098_007791, partial [Nowakowskiella sp. JEL0407]
FNGIVGEGGDWNYMEVPFPNGQLPMLPPHNLPPLRSEADIMGLPGHQLTDYLVGYGEPVPQLILARMLCPLR